MRGRMCASEAMGVNCLETEKICLNTLRRVLAKQTTGNSYKVSKWDLILTASLK